MYIALVIDVDRTWKIIKIGDKLMWKIPIFDVKDNYLSRGL